MLHSVCHEVSGISGLGLAQCARVFLISFSMLFSSVCTSDAPCFRRIGCFRCRAFLGMGCCGWVCGRLASPPATEKAECQHGAGLLAEDFCDGGAAVGAYGAACRFELLRQMQNLPNLLHLAALAGVRRRFNPLLAIAALRFPQIPWRNTVC